MRMMQLRFPKPLKVPFQLVHLPRFHKALSEIHAGQVIGRETDPVGYLYQDKFLNCVLEVETLSGPRTIYLDILFYDDIVTLFEDAVIPHPRLPERKFVLKPLCDIAPREWGKD